MRILITGGAGFIGSHLAESFQGEAEVRVLDNLRTGSAANLNGLRTELIEASVLDRRALEQTMKGVDYVFHLAAMVSVPESTLDPEACEEINGAGTLRVLEAAAANRVRKVFFASSAAVYGDNPEVPKTESMLPEPRSPYAITKLLGEHYCDFYRRTGRVNTAALRFFNVFGPRQDPNGPYAAAVPIFIENALLNRPLVIHGDGGQTRDFIYVKDIVAAIRHVTLNPEPSGVYNAGCGGSMTIRDLADRILALTESSSTIEFRPVRAGDVRHSRASIEALARTGFRPSEPFDDGLRATIEFFRSRLPAAATPAPVPA